MTKPMMWVLYGSHSGERRVTQRFLKDAIKNSLVVFSAGTLEGGWMFFVSPYGNWALAVKEK